MATPARASGGLVHIPVTSGASVKVIPAGSAVGSSACSPASRRCGSFMSICLWGALRKAVQSRCACSLLTGQLSRTDMSHLEGRLAFVLLTLTHSWNANDVQL